MAKLRLIKGKRPVQDYIIGKCRTFGTHMVKMRDGSVQKQEKPFRTDSHTLVLIDGHVQLVAKKNLETY